MHHGTDLYFFFMPVKLTMLLKTADLEKPVSKILMTSPFLAKRNLYSTHRLMAPPTVQPCDAVVRLDGLAALVTLACTVTFHPVVVHYLQSQQATLIMLACTVTFHQKMVCYPHASRCTFQTCENEHCMFSVPISWACCCYHIRLPHKVITAC